MTEIDLRALVREAVERHLGRPAADPQPAPARPAAAHHAHGLYLTLVNSTDRCVIEPSVPCEHCGYCKTHGY